MIDLWNTSFENDVFVIVLSTIGIYVTLIMLARLGGQSKPEKRISFSFMVTMILSLIIAIAVVPQVLWLQYSLIFIGIVYSLHKLVVRAREWKPLSARGRQKTIVLMRHGKFLKRNLKRSKLTESYVRTHLRDAHIFESSKVKVLFNETTEELTIIQPSKPQVKDQWIVEC